MSDNEHIVGLFNESPDMQEHPGHPTNMLRFLGAQMYSYRKRLPEANRSAEKFSRIIERYVGSERRPSRDLIARAEKGTAFVSFGVFASYLFEMGVMPDLLKGTCKGRPMPLQLALAIDKDLPRYLRHLELKNTPVVPDDGEEADV